MTHNAIEIVRAAVSAYDAGAGGALLARPRVSEAVLRLEQSYSDRVAHQRVEELASLEDMSKVLAGFHWRCCLSREPSGGSDHFVTAVALRLVAFRITQMSGAVDAGNGLLEFPTVTSEPAAAASVLLREGSRLMRQGEAANDANAYRRAADTFAQALDGVGADDYVNRSSAHINIASAWTRRFLLTDSRDDLEQALGCAAAAIVGSMEHPHAWRMFEQLSSLLLHRHHAEQRVGDFLLDAIVAMERACELAPVDERARLLCALGHQFLFDGFEATGITALLDSAIAAYRKSAESVGPGHHDYGAYLGNVGNALLRRHDHLGDPDALRTAIDVLYTALEEADDEEKELSSLVSNLGKGLAELSEISDDAALLEQASEYAEWALSLTPPGHADRPAFLCNSALTLRKLWARYGGDPDLLDRVVTRHREAVAGLPLRDPDWATCMYGLAGALHKRSRFDRLGRGAADLQEALDAFRRTVEATGFDSTDRAARLAELGRALIMTYEDSGEPGHLDEAERVCAQALEAASPGHADRSVCLSTSASVHTHRYDLSGDPTYLQKAVAVSRDALSLLSPEHAQRPAQESNLGGLLARQFGVVRSLALLDEAVALLRSAVDRTARTHQDWPARKSSLASALYLRFEFVGDTAALNEALAHARQAVVAAPSGSRDAVNFRSVMGGTLIRIAGRAGQDDRLDAEAFGREAVDVLTEAYAGLPPAAPERAQCLSNLGAAQGRLAASCGDLDMFEHAVRSCRAAADAADDRPLIQAVSLMNAAVCLQRRYNHTGHPDDLDGAVEFARDALALVPVSSADRTVHAVGLATMLMQRDATHPSDADRREALRCAREAAALDTGSPIMRAQGARLWGRIAAERADWADAVHGYGAAVSLLDTVAWRGLGRNDRERLLADLAGVACDAAACAVHDQQPERAVELLEQGRGVLFAQMTDMNADLQALAEVDAGLATRLEDVSVALTAAGAHVPWQVTDMDGSQDEAKVRDRLNSLAEERERLVRRARQVLGSTFMAAPRYADLQAAAVEGPVVLLNVGRFRCDALIVGTDGVMVEPLGLAYGDVATRTADFIRALGVLQQGGAGIDDHEDAQRATQARRTLNGVLAWLWDTVVEPVLARLAVTGRAPEGQEPMRIWWCPTNLLSLLPLHAAGRHGTCDDVIPMTLIDRAVSSYTPTLRALIQARAALETATSESARPLVVSVSCAPDAPPLRHVPSEARSVLRRFPAGSPLDGSQATVAAVSAALEHHSWVHFACHGTQDVLDPSAGHLLLHDGPLRIADIAHLSRGPRELAYLSACSTSRGGVRLPDESVTVAAALQHVGYRHVVAALWWLMDAESPQVAEDFYNQLTSGPDRVDAQRSARALHRAVLALRERFPSAPACWAQYVHFGP